LQHTRQPTIWTEAKACKLFARGGELIYDEMHNHCAIFAPNGTYQAIIIVSSRPEGMGRLCAQQTQEWHHQTDLMKTLSPIGLEIVRIGVNQALTKGPQPQRITLEQLHGTISLLHKDKGSTDRTARLMVLSKTTGLQSDDYM
jgi:hypothetical protein